MQFPSPSNPPKPRGFFATTHWSLVLDARDSQSPEAESAMERLCRSYWTPLYGFARRAGYRHEDACDLTQEFFARFLEKRYLRSVEPRLGKFRTFLLTSFTHFLANEWDKSQAQRRGGGLRILSLEEAAAAEADYSLGSSNEVAPERLFDRVWAERVLSVVLDRLAEETNEERFEALKMFLLDEKGAASYEDAAKQLRISVPAVTSAIHRMRGRFRALLFDEVAHTVASPEEVDGELRHLLAALAD